MGEGHSTVNPSFGITLILALGFHIDFFGLFFPLEFAERRSLFGQ